MQCHHRWHAAGIPGTQCHFQRMERVAQGTERQILSTMASHSLSFSWFPSAGLLCWGWSRTGKVLLRTEHSQPNSEILGFLSFAAHCWLQCSIPRITPGSQEVCTLCWMLTILLLLPSPGVISLMAGFCWDVQGWLFPPHIWVGSRGPATCLPSSCNKVSFMSMALAEHFRIL